MRAPMWPTRSSDNRPTLRKDESQTKARTPTIENSPKFSPKQSEHLCLPRTLFRETGNRAESSTFTDNQEDGKSERDGTPTTEAAARATGTATRATETMTPRWRKGRTRHGTRLAEHECCETGRDDAFSQKQCTNTPRAENGYAKPSALTFVNLESGHQTDEPDGRPKKALSQRI